MIIVIVIIIIIIIINLILVKRLKLSGIFGFLLTPFAIWIG